MISPALDVEAAAELVDDVLDAGGVPDDELVADDVVLTASNVHLLKKSRRSGVASNELPLAREGQ